MLFLAATHTGKQRRALSADARGELVPAVLHEPDGRPRRILCGREPRDLMSVALPSSLARAGRWVTWCWGMHAATPPVPPPHTRISALKHSRRVSLPHTHARAHLGLCERLLGVLEEGRRVKARRPVLAVDGPGEVRIDVGEDGGREGAERPAVEVGGLDGEPRENLWLHGATHPRHLYRARLCTSSSSSSGKQRGRAVDRAKFAPSSPPCPPPPAPAPKNEPQTLPPLSTPLAPAPAPA